MPWHTAQRLSGTAQTGEQGIAQRQQLRAAMPKYGKETARVSGQEIRHTANGGDRRQDGPWLHCLSAPGSQQQGDITVGCEYSPLLQCLQEHAGGSNEGRGNGGESY